MTTVEDKLKVFAKLIFEKVEKDSELKVLEFTKDSDQVLEREKKNILKESENLIRQMKKRAETKKNQIISKANIDSQHDLLKQRKELFDRLIDDIKKLALDYVNTLEYTVFLEKSIKNSLVQINAASVVLQFKQRDIDNHKDFIINIVEKYRDKDINTSIEAVDRDIIGGCICEDVEKTVRVDCSMASMIEDNRALIGKILMDNLQ